MESVAGFARNTQDEELLLDEQILGNEGFGTARTKEPGDGGQTVD